MVACAFVRRCWSASCVLWLGLKEGCVTASSTMLCQPACMSYAVCFTFHHREQNARSNEGASVVYILNILKMPVIPNRT